MFLGIIKVIFINYYLISKFDKQFFYMFKFKIKIKIFFIKNIKVILIIKFK